MLQHTSSCDGRRNSTFWISCLLSHGRESSRGILCPLRPQQR